LEVEVRELILDDPIETIKALGKKWESAWNQHDMAALAGLIAENGDFVTVGGRWLKGRREFEDYHTRYHKTRFKDTIWTTTDTHVRFVSEDLAIVHAVWQLGGERDPEYGTPRQPRNGMFTWIVARTDGKWLIDAAQNTNIPLDYSQYRESLKMSSE
jgi:uncharacterized protein (TIGR02246 family)